ncbi:MAG: family 43 glycosylhydrolase [Candidatus Borkfalkiaceae bacterium]|nr:family 43 glycosylhydrolase [bacterium]MDY2851643.1 family 43 glycosylhydrolase [Christensenellaceae bacterium]
MYHSIRPGKTWYDSNGKRIQAHGGSILYAEGKFWWYGENKEGITGRSTGEPCRFWHHGVKLYSSVDLYNWKDEGFAMKESDDVNNPFYPGNIMDRPHIIFNKKTQTYVLWAKTARGDFTDASFSVCVGKDLHSFSFLKGISPSPHHAGDFDLFEANGKAYIVYENPHSEMICRELTNDYTGLTDNFVSELKAECPPYVREAPAFFERNGRRFIITSGTTGYYPNPSKTSEITDLFEIWRDLGDICVNDKNRNSFKAQFSSVFKHPFVKDLYIAIGDRWLTDLTEDLPDMEEVFYGLFSEKGKKIVEAAELSSFSDENTSEADYVWLPIRFKEDGTPYIEWLREWKIDSFE